MKNNNFTKALKHKVKLDNTLPAVTPLFQSSAFQAESEYFYSRKDNPNVRQFEEAVSILEGSKYGLATTNGMSAISLVLSLVRPGESVVINSLIYGCSFEFFKLIEKIRDIKIQVIDLTENILIDSFPNNTRLVFFETPTNPFLKTVEIAKTSKIIKSKFPNALIVVDNTWATPLFQKPLSLGADISLHSATKFISGHSDVMGGIILSNNRELANTLRSYRFYFGANLDPHSAWLLCRSLQTLEIRLNEHVNKTSKMVEWLKNKPFIEKVYYPKISEDQLENYGGILFLKIKNYKNGNYKSFRNSLEFFETGTGMACVTSMVAQPFSGSHASMDDVDKYGMGIDKSLIRLCFGLEDINILKNDLDQAFNKMLVMNKD